VQCEFCDGTGAEHLWPARDQLIDFAQAITQGRPPKVTGEEGSRVIRLIEQCYAMKKQRPLPGLAPIPGAMW
jgi:predicted dehydrogenase